MLYIPWPRPPAAFLWESLCKEFYVPRIFFPMGVAWSPGSSGPRRATFSKIGYPRGRWAPGSCPIPLFLPDGVDLPKNRHFFHLVHEFSLFLKCGWVAAQCRDPATFQKNPRITIETKGSCDRGRSQVDLRSTSWAASESPSELSRARRNVYFYSTACAFVIIPQRSKKTHAVE